MKPVFKGIRFSRKFILIGGGVLLLGGASGVAAIVIGKDQLFGEKEVVQNGLECKTAQTVNIKKNGSVWIRKFVRTEGGDGVERVKTALRVAKAIYDKQKPDLVQVSVLDEKGPQMRAEMRGRAIAAQVVYIPDLAKLPDSAATQHYSAYYYDGAAAGDGQFYGLRIDLPVEDAEAMTASLTEFADCVDPVVAAPADAHGGGHGAASGGHGEPAASGSDAHGSDGHGSDGHGAAAEASGGHGESKPADGHGGESAAADGHGGEEKPAEGGGHDAPASAESGGHDAPQPLLTSTPEGKSESMFSFGYIKSLLFGKGESKAHAAEPGDAAAAGGHGETPVAEEPAAHGDAAAAPHDTAPAAEAEHKSEDAPKPEH